jgi:hypothetical protein
LWRLRHNTARPDILAADKPQPVDALFVVETDGFRDFVHSFPDPVSAIAPGRCKMLATFTP